MKPLIAIACLCVIAATGWWVWTEYRAERERYRAERERDNRAAYQACVRDKMVNEGETKARADVLCLIVWNMYR